MKTDTNNRKMDKLIDKKQPFGVKYDETPMGGQGRPAQDLNKPLGGPTMRANNGMDHGPSFGDKNPSAHSDACAHVDHPFFWSGRPKKDTGNIRYEQEEIR